MGILGENIGTFYVEIRSHGAIKMVIVLVVFCCGSGSLQFFVFVGQWVSQQCYDHAAICDDAVICGQWPA